MSDEQMSALEKVQAELEELEAEHKLESEAQLAVDLRALLDAKRAHGVNRVAALEVPYDQDGSPTLVIVRAPSEIEINRYRDLVRRDEDDKKAIQGHVEQLGRTCLVYPDAETLAGMCKRRPLVAAQAGNAASQLALAHERAEGKGGTR